MKTVHVETGRHLYGGPQQVLYLLAGLTDRAIDCTLVCPPGSEIAVAARGRSLPTVELDCQGDLDLRFIWRLRDCLDRLRPDLVHCHSRRGADFMGGQAAAMLGIPAVVSRRVDNAERAWVASLRYRRFAKIIAISAAIAEVLTAAGVDPERVEVIRSAVDVARFEGPADRARLAAEFGIAADQFAIACAAQLIARKGQRFLLDAAARLRDVHPHMRIVLFGKGALEAELKRHCTALGLDALVQFAGFRADLDDYLGAFDLLVHPALSEGLGVVTLKAQAAGVPVVAANAGGLPEAVADGESGVLVPPGDVEALADALNELLDDSGLRGRYASQARERMRTSYSVDAMVDAHARLYDTVLNESSRRPQ